MKKNFVDIYLINLTTYLSNMEQYVGAILSVNFVAPRPRLELGTLELTALCSTD